MTTGRVEPLAQPLKGTCVGFGHVSLRQRSKAGCLQAEGKAKAL